jgi:hypothetical protein
MLLNDFIKEVLYAHLLQSALENLNHVIVHGHSFSVFDVVLSETVPATITSVWHY